MSQPKIDPNLLEIVQIEAKKAAEAVYATKGTQYGVADIPTHTHNGVDSLQIPSTSVINGNKYITLLIEDTTEVVSIAGISSPSRIVFNGFVANNVAAPATKRAIINGEVLFGTGIAFSDITPPYVVSTTGPGTPFVQFCNYMYVDTAALANNRVGASVTSFIYAEDTAAPVVTGTLTSFNNQTGIATLSFTLAANYKVQGTFVISS